MIFLYYGKIGDGKTYHVMYNELLPAVRDGRKIYTNIEGLDLRHIRMMTGVEPIIIYIATHAELKKLMGVEPEDKNGDGLLIDKGSLVIIDEAQLVWDARDHKNTSKNFLTLLEYHRHFGLDLVFITQNPKRLEAAVTRLANHSYQVKNLGFLFGPLKNRYVLHIRQTPFDRDIVATMSGKFQKAVFSCYASTVVARAGTHSAKRKTALQGGFFYFLLMLVALTAFMFISRGGFHILTPIKLQSVNTEVKNVSLVSAQGGVAVPVVSAGSITLPVPEKEIRSGLKKRREENCTDAGYYVFNQERINISSCNGRIVEKRDFTL